MPEGVALFEALRSVAMIVEGVAEGEPLPPFLVQEIDAHMETIRRFMPRQPPVGVSTVVELVGRFSETLVDRCARWVVLPVQAGERARVARALRVPTQKKDGRPRIISYIAQNPGCTVDQIAQHLDLPTPFVSSCLTRLKNEGNVKRDDARPAHWCATGENNPARRGEIKPEVWAFVREMSGHTFTAIDLAERLGTTTGAVASTLWALRNRHVIEPDPYGWRVVDTVRENGRMDHPRLVL
jgi:hypothetical protein